MNKFGLVKLKQVKTRKRCVVRGVTLFWIAVACAGLTCGAIGFAKRWHVVVYSVVECDPANAAAAPTSGPSILLFGDSLTELGGDPSAGGWVPQLQYDYHRSVTFSNRGLSSWNTAGFVEKVLPKITAAFAPPQATMPVLITVWFGANDAALVDGPEAGKHVDIDIYRANLILILQTFRKLAPKTKLLLITPPVVGDAQRLQIQLAAGRAAGDPLDRNNEQAAKYAAACGQAAQEVEGVAFLNLHAFFMEKYPNASDRDVFLDGGLHFTKQGNGLVYGQIKKEIEQLVPANLLRTGWFP